MDQNLLSFFQDDPRVLKLKIKPQDFQGPRGEKGPKGDKGNKGDSGPMGPKGDRGNRGDVGTMGLKGDRGESGSKGDPGLPGPKGDQGLPGSKGDPGLPGEKGDPGLPGEKGDKGEKGDPGLPGFKGDPGLKGEPGLRGLPGPKGDPGLKGEKGNPGLPGIKGDKGEPGLPGAKGEKGDIGSMGLKGDKGDSGLPGLKGDPGLPGAKGEPGISRPIGNSLFVDSVSGNDETGCRNNFSLAFASLERAEKLAMKGDSIFVSAGRYEVTGLTRSVHWNFNSGVELIKKGDGPMFKPTGDLVIGGQVNIDANGQPILFMDNFSVTLNVHNVSNSGYSDKILFEVRGGNLSLNCNKISPGKQLFMKVSGEEFNRPRVHLNVQEIYQGGNGHVFEFYPHSITYSKINTIVTFSGNGWLIDGGHHVIDCHNIEAPLTIKGGNNFINFSRLRCHTMISGGITHFKGKEITATNPFILSNNPTLHLNVDRADITESLISGKLDSNSKIYCNIAEVVSITKSSIINLNSCQYSTGKLPYFNLKIKSSEVNQVLNIGDNVRIILDCKLGRVESTTLGVIGNILPESLIYIKTNIAETEKECLLIGKNDASIKIEGCYYSDGINGIFTDSPILLTNGIINASCFSVSTNLEKLSIKQQNMIFKCKSHKNIVII